MFRLVTLAALLSFTMTSMAWAHPKILEPNPAADSETAQSPEEIRIRFSEKILPQLSGITLTDEDGRVVKTEKAVKADDPQLLSVPVAEDLGPGEYIVKWHVVASDSHRIEGSYRFRVTP